VSSPFGRGTLIVVVTAVLVSGAVAIALTLIGDDLAERPTEHVDSYSRSAIGHRALVKLLERLDIPVIVSRYESQTKVNRGVLVVIEPDIGSKAARDRLWNLVKTDAHVLVVLPKWRTWGNARDRWIERVYPVSPREIEEVLAAIAVPDAQLVRRGTRPAWSTTGDWWGTAAPAIKQPQVVKSPSLEPRVRDGDRTLLGVVPRSTTSELWVLSDPDVLNNQGLRHPENARFAIELLDHLRGEGPVVIDETSHGYLRPPGLVATLLSFPLVIPTLQIALCTLLVMWAAAVRFGPRRPAPPPIAPGKDFLIRNTAALLHYGGHHAEALRRYLSLAIGDVRRELHVPSLAHPQAVEWLERVRITRGGSVSLVDLERAVEAGGSPQRIVEVADRIHRWRMEMTHGIDRST
jgi:uncharacterized protein DUF4350